MRVLSIDVLVELLHVVGSIGVILALEKVEFGQLVYAIKCGAELLTTTSIDWLAFPIGQSDGRRRDDLSATPI